MPNEPLAYQSKFKYLLMFQIVLLLTALSAFVYISSKVSSELKAYKTLKETRDQAEQEYRALRSNIEKFHSLKITSANEVYEVKATARATGAKTPQGYPVYKFSMYINSPPELLHSITKVTYEFNHPTFSKPLHEVTDARSKFATFYTGWGCLNSVLVKVYLSDNTLQTIDFNMCKNIGWE